LDASRAFNHVGFFAFGEDGRLGYLKLREWIPNYFATARGKVASKSISFLRLYE